MRRGQAEGGPIRRWRSEAVRAEAARAEEAEPSEPEPRTSEPKGPICWSRANKRAKDKRVRGRQKQSSAIVAERPSGRAPKATESWTGRLRTAAAEDRSHRGSQRPRTGTAEDRSDRGPERRRTGAAEDRSGGGPERPRTGAAEWKKTNARGQGGPICWSRVDIYTDKQTNEQTNKRQDRMRKVRAGECRGGRALEMLRARTAGQHRAREHLDCMSESNKNTVRKINAQ